MLQKSNMQKEQRRAEMKALVDQWHTSGQSKRSFAESHKIGYHTFLYWYHKLLLISLQISDSSQGRHNTLSILDNCVSN